MGVRLERGDPPRLFWGRIFCVEEIVAADRISYFKGWILSSGVLRYVRLPWLPPRRIRAVPKVLKPLRRGSLERSAYIELLKGKKGASPFSAHPAFSPRLFIAALLAFRSLAFPLSLALFLPLPWLGSAVKRINTFWQERQTAHTHTHTHTFKQHVHPKERLCVHMYCLSALHWVKECLTMWWNPHTHKHTPWCELMCLLCACTVHEGWTYTNQNTSVYIRACMSVFVCLRDYIHTS